MTNVNGCGEEMCEKQREKGEQKINGGCETPTSLNHQKIVNLAKRYDEGTDENVPFKAGGGARFCGGSSEMHVPAGEHSQVEKSR